MARSAPIHRSRLWYLFPVFLGVIGGLIAYFILRDSNLAMASNTLWIGIILSANVTAIAISIYWMYYIDITAARERISTSNVVDTAYGQIEYTDVGEGSPILSIHGAGGGFDQGLLT